jgi:16S rRNA processing protein RimM
MDIRVGEVVAAHGLDGGLKVLPASDHHAEWPERLKAVAVDRLAMRVVPVRAVRQAGGLPVLLLEGIMTRSSAEALVGARLYVDAATLPRLPDGEYWWYELLDLAVLLPDETPLGHVRHVSRAGPHDILEVATPTGTLMVPFVKAWVEVLEDPRRLRLRQDPRHVD